MGAAAWIRINASEWPVHSVEQAGSTENRWLIEPGTDELWLHKDTHIPSNGIEQGEDWSEVVSTQAAKDLGIPCAETLLCLRNGRRGSLSRRVFDTEAARRVSLHEGRVVLERFGAPGYVRHSEGKPAVDPNRPHLKRPGHSLENILGALAEVSPPAGFIGGDGLSGFDVFTGYLLLDALIGNPDRHEQNWAVLVPQLTNVRERLAPTYDHASSLGYNLTDGKRSTLLASPAALQRWAENGRARRYEHQGRPVSLVTHAATALELCSPQGRTWWTEVVNQASLSGTQDVLSHEIHGLSDHASRFASELLELNLRRLRHVISSNE